MALEISNIPEYGVNGSTARVPKKELGKDDFLLLLTKQLQNQDPMKPTDNAEFVSQMSQFSALEQMTNMNKTMEKFVNTSNENYKSQAIGLMGKQVTCVSTSGDPTPKTGVVESVSFVKGEALFKVGGQDYTIADITKVEYPEDSYFTGTGAATGAGAGAATATGAGAGTGTTTATGAGTESTSTAAS